MLHLLKASHQQYFSFLKDAKFFFFFFFTLFNSKHTRIQGQGVNLSGKFHASHAQTSVLTLLILWITLTVTVINSRFLYSYSLRGYRAGWDREPLPSLTEFMGFSALPLHVSVVWEDESLKFTPMGTHKRLGWMLLFSFLAGLLPAKGGISKCMKCDVGSRVVQLLVWLCISGYMLQNMEFGV